MEFWGALSGVCGGAFGEFERYFAWKAYAMIPTTAFGKEVHVWFDSFELDFNERS